MAIASPAAINAKTRANKRGLEESLGYNQQNQLLLLSTLANHQHGILANELPSLGGHDLNLLGAQLQDYSLLSSSIGDYTALPVSNFQIGNTAPAPSPTVKPVASVSVPPSTPTASAAPQQTQSQPQTNAAPAATISPAPVTLTVPAVASASLQLQVPAQVQTIQTSSVQQQAAPAPVQTASAVQNVGKSSSTLPTSSFNIQQNQQNTQQNAQKQSIIPTSSLVNQIGQQSLSYGDIQSLQFTQGHGGFEQNVASLIHVDPSIQLLQQVPIIRYSNIEAFPLSQHYERLQQGIYGNLLDQKPLLGSYNLVKL